MKNQKNFNVLNLPSIEKTRVTELLQQLEKEFDKIISENDGLRKALNESYKANQALEAKLSAANSKNAKIEKAEKVEKTEKTEKPPTEKIAELSTSNAVISSPVTATPNNVGTPANALNTAEKPIKESDKEEIPKELSKEKEQIQPKEIPKEIPKESQKEKDAQKEKEKEKTKEKEKEKSKTNSRKKMKNNEEVVQKSQMNRIVRRFFHDDSIWDVEHFQIMDSVSGEVEDVLATAGCAGTVNIWSQQNIDPVFVFDGHRGSVNCVKVNNFSTASLLASASGDGSVQIFMLPLEKLNSKLRIMPKFHSTRKNLLNNNIVATGEIFGGSAGNNLSNAASRLVANVDLNDIIENDEEDELINHRNSSNSQQTSPANAPNEIEALAQKNSIERRLSKLKKRRSFLSYEKYNPLYNYNNFPTQHQLQPNFQNFNVSGNTEDELLDGSQSDGSSSSNSSSGSSSDGESDNSDNSSGGENENIPEKPEKHNTSNLNLNLNLNNNQNNQNNNNYYGKDQNLVNQNDNDDNMDDDDELFTQTMFDDNSELISNRSIYFSNSEAILGNHGSPVMTCEWLKENVLVSGTMDGKMRIFTLNPSTMVPALINPPISAHEGKINQISGNSQNNRSSSADFSSTFASCGKDGNVRIWDSKTNLQVTAIKVNSDSVNSVQYSVNDKYLLSGGDDQHLRVWDTRNFKNPVISVAAGSAINDISVSAHSQIALGLSRYALSIYNFGGEKVSDLSNLEYGHTKMITSVCWDSEGQNVYSSSIDKKAIQWLFQ